jgi:hypothetical protein
VFGGSGRGSGRDFLIENSGGIVIMAEFLEWS